jgi:hypothetical protein
VEGGWTEGALKGIKLNTIKPLLAKKSLRRGAGGIKEKPRFEEPGLYSLGD